MLQLFAARLLRDVAHKLRRFGHSMYIRHTVNTCARNEEQCSIIFPYLCLSLPRSVYLYKNIASCTSTENLGCPQKINQFVTEDKNKTKQKST